MSPRIRPHYRQCDLSRPSGNGTECTTTWIPEQFASVGKRLRLKVDGQWQEGWTVMRAGLRWLSEEEVPSWRLGDAGV